MRYRAIQEHGRREPIRLMCRGLRHPSDLSRALRTYGSPSIWGTLVKRGFFSLDPAKYLSFLPRGQGPWAAGRGARRVRVESVATPTCHREPAIERAAMKAVAGDHLARAHALDGHRADGLQSAGIQCPSVSRHSGTEYDTISMCCLYY